MTSTASPSSPAPASSSHQLWNAEALWETLTPLLPGISIEVLARTESTNTALLERVRRDQQDEARRADYGRRANDLQPCLLVAEHQSAGRGRLGRAWQSAPRQSLTFSLGLALDMADWSGLSLAVGCAIADALEPLAEGQTPRLQLKWPNDIWLDGRKLGGILIETVPAGEQRIAVIGVGLNIHPLGGDGDAAQFASGYASLDEFLPGIDAPAALARIAPALVRALLAFPQGGFAPWQPAFARRDLTLGRMITAGALQGESRGVNAGGELLVATAPGVVQCVSGGEVSVRLAPASPAGAA